MKRINSHPYLMLKPIVVVGAIVDGRVNFMTIADIIATGRRIPRFGISSRKPHYTNKGIIENETFSINIPSQEMIVKADYCGIVSGQEVDKSTVFDVFYGKGLKTAPMIEEAPITHACKLVKTVDFGDTHYLFIGEVIETYINEDFIADERPDIKNVKPITFYQDYWKVGDKFAEAFKIGKEYKKS